MSDVNRVAIEESNGNGSNGNQLSLKSYDKTASVRYLLKPFGIFLEDQDITEICVNRPGEVYCERCSAWEYYEVEALDLDHCRSLAIAIANYSSNEISEGHPILSAVLPGGERIQVIFPPACERDTISITIRKPSRNIIMIEDFQKQGFFNYVKPLTRGLTDDEKEMESLLEKKNYLEFLVKAVRTKKVIVIAGETGSGKTTFMKALMQEVPLHERIITIEDVSELFLPNHRNHVHLFYPSEATNESAVNSQKLLKSTLRMKPDRIMLAELRGGETFDFINIAASGHGGSITSCHAGSAELTFERLALMVLQNEQGKEIPIEVIRKLLYLVVDVVVHIHNDTSGCGRHITEIYFDPARKRSLDS
jgi:type IV secretion system protein VirB11